MGNVVMSRRDLCYVAILPIRNVNLTSLPIARIVLILKVELFFADHRRQRLDRSFEDLLERAKIEDFRFMICGTHLRPGT